MTATVILAAGASRRLGAAKQTLSFKNSSLLQHTIRVAVNAQIGPVVVILGANHEDIQPHIKNEPVSILINEDWRNGMSSSIKQSILFLQDNYPQVEAVLLLVCDQPYVDKQLLQSLVVAKQQTRQPMVACSYNNTVGVPVLISKIFFPDLLNLQGEDGGKKILREHKDQLATVYFPKGAIDIDTISDYAALVETES